MKTRLEEELEKAKRKAMDESNERERLTGKTCGYRQDLALRVVQLQQYIRDGAVLGEDGYIRYPDKPTLLGYD
jgi:hypothetical protein